MKKIVAIIIIAIESIPLGYSQIPNGFWQNGTSKIEVKLNAGYFFSKNHKFEYIISEYDGLNPIITFGGTYSIKNKNIKFYITYVKKRIGGKLSRDSQYRLNDSWAFIGGKILKIELKPPIIESEENIQITKNYISFADKYYRTTRETQ
ncbi:MAG: hypothetical protein GX416_13955 [Bacteroidales bacterium]|nr:hypothetical protein [Bacteroidales bacterium]